MDRLIAQLAKTPAEALAEPTRDDDASDKELKGALDQARLAELQAANTYRKDLVKFTRWTVGSLVTAATLFMGLYIWSQWAAVEASVMIAYFTSVVLEVVGILYIIARYLFPSSGAGERSSTHSNRRSE